jgi:hypothetical protein
MAEFGKAPPPKAPTEKPLEAPAERPAKAAPSLSDKRAGVRRRVLFSGRLVHSKQEMSMACAIQDLSTTGARVKLAGFDALGDPLYLIDMRNGLAYRAQLRWREGDRAGLAFLSYHDLAKPDPALPPILRRLWLESVR